jgi:hypothetical protein
MTGFAGTPGLIVPDDLVLEDIVYGSRTSRGLGMQYTIALAFLCCNEVMVSLCP